MKTVAIISEYNPFHLGHEYQIKKIREAFGTDTAIIALMSGNITQRGELAILDKCYRAKTAILGGANLVLEIPFPYCAQSAEFYAEAGVHIAEQLSVVDYLSFGSESGDLEALTRTAEAMLSTEYENALAEVTKCKELGYAKSCELALSALGECALDFKPNNILALEYIKAIKRNNSNIVPHTVLRQGGEYNDDRVASCAFSSALAIRRLYTEGNCELAEKQLPNYTASVIEDAAAVGDFPIKIEPLSHALLAHFRLNSPISPNIHEASGGLYNRLCNASYEANDIYTLLKLAESKKFTNTRIRRAVWNSFFGVTSSDLKTKPEYTQVLAMDKIGAETLRKIKKASDFQILTKPSATDELKYGAKRQKALSDTADAIYDLAKPKPKGGGYFLKTTPFVKK